MVSGCLSSKDQARDGDSPCVKEDGRHKCRNDTLNRLHCTISVAT